MHSIRNGRLSDRQVGVLLILPGLAVFAAIILYPFVDAILMSFTDRSMIYPNYSWVGLDNYKRLIHDEFFWIALKNTCVYTLLYVPGGLLISLGAALFLNTNRKFVGVFRTLFYLPVLSSTVATATLWFWILNPQLGLLNGLLGLFGISGPAWLYDNKYAMLAVVMMSLWAGFGTNMMIFLSGLKAVPSSQQTFAPDRAVAVASSMIRRSPATTFSPRQGTSSPHTWTRYSGRVSPSRVDMAAIQNRSLSELGQLWMGAETWKVPVWMSL